MNSERAIDSKLSLTALLRIAAFGLVAILSLTIAAWVILFPSPRFPKPTGPYAIGTKVYFSTDTSRAEPFTSEQNDLRQMAVQIWYPAVGQGEFAPYIDNDEPMNVLAKQFHIPAFLLRNIQNAPTHARMNAVPAKGRFPVLINPAGLMAFRSASLFWIEELASQGYVVVGLDQPGASAATVLPNGKVIRAMDKVAFDWFMPLALSSAPNHSPVMNGVALPGGIIPYLAQDVSFVLTQIERLDRTDPALAGHMDTGRVGVFGMSLGGYVAPEVCQTDTRFAACLGVDAGKTATVARDGLIQPLMIISRDAGTMRAERSKAGGWPEPEITHTITTQRALFQHNRGPAYYVTMNEMFHANWTDAPLWSPLVRWIGLAGPIAPYQGFAATNAYTLGFFDRHLKGKSAPILERLPQSYPDTQLEISPPTNERPVP
jgi:hypothetical protein